jgi:hypothetical protein
MNSMRDSFGEGIDYDNNGVTPNDSPDVNGVPNFPLINQAWIMPEGTRIIGSLTTTANTNITIHAYSRPPTPAIGTNEGKLYLGVIPATTDGSGVANYDAIVTGPAVPFGDVVMLTATGPQGTSEFSANVAAQDNTAPAVEDGGFEFELGHSFRVNFNGSIDFSTLAPDDLVVQSDSALRELFTPDAVYYDQQTNEAAFSFFTSLPDGIYTATLAAGSVADAAGNTNTMQFSKEFFVLAADANRDEVVNIDDLLIVAANWKQSGRTFSEGDFDGDGFVGELDLGILAENWMKRADGTTIAGAPMPSIAGITQPQQPAAPPRRANTPIRPATRVAIGILDPSPPELSNRVLPA